MMTASVLNVLRILLPLLLAVFALSPELPAQSPAMRSDSRPNIVFIFSDDHAWQAISAYGSDRNTTPGIDRLASEGMRFANCFVTNSICAPSRATILTGKHTHLNGITTNERIFDSRQTLFPALLRKAGYETALVGKWHLNTEPTGFDYWDILINQGTYYNPDMIRNGQRVKRQGYTTDIITDLSIEWLSQRRDTTKPFLLLSQHKATHREWDPALRHIQLYNDSTLVEPPTLFEDWSDRSSAWTYAQMSIEQYLTPGDLHLRTPTWQLTDSQQVIWESLYKEENEAFRKAKLAGIPLTKWKYQRYVKDYMRTVASMDEGIERLLNYLDSTGLSHNTMVVYSSDQGMYLGEHGMFDKRWMYEESFRMPFLVRWPGNVPAGRVNADLVQNLDFAQTFLDLAGVPAPKDMQGRSLVPLLKGEKPVDWRSSVYYQFYESEGAHRVPRHYGVRTDRYKLIHFYEIDEWEMFDLRADSLERHSVYGDAAYAAVQKDLEKELRRLRDEYRVTKQADEEYDRFETYYQGRGKFMGLVGRAPIRRNAAPTTVKVDDFPEFRRELISYTIGEQTIQAYILVPRNRQELLPAVVAIHSGRESGSYAFGKSAVVGAAGDTSTAFGLDLVRRGYLVFCADRFGFESRRLKASGDRGESERIRMSEAARSMLVEGSSLLAREIAELRFAVDYVSRRPEVHSLRVGMIGYGEGGLLSTIASAENEWVLATVAGDGVRPFREILTKETTDENARVQSLLTIPGVHAWGDIGKMVAIVYPRSILIQESVSTVEKHLAEARARYGDRDMSGRLVLRPVQKTGALRSQPARREAYEWLDQWLKHPIE